MAKDRTSSTLEVISFLIFILVFMNETIAAAIGLAAAIAIWFFVVPYWGITKTKVALFSLLVASFLLDYYFFKNRDFITQIIHIQKPTLHFSGKTFKYIPVALWSLSLCWKKDIESKIKAPTKKRKHIEPMSTGCHSSQSALIGFYGSYKSRDQVSIPMNAGEHLLISGRTGCGKTACASNLIEWAICNNHPVFCIDGKGAKGKYSLFDLMNNLSVKHGMKLNIIDLVNPDCSTIKYNPFKNKNAVEKRDLLLLIGEPWSEEHYRIQAANYWTVMCQALEIEGRETTLETMSKFSCPTELNALIAHLQKECKITADTSAKWKLIAKNNGEAAEAASARFQLLTHGEPGKLFASNTEGVSALDIWKNSESCLLMLDQSYSDFTARLGGLFLADLKHVCAYANAGHDAKTTLLICDEAGSYINNKSAGDAILTIYSQGRTAGYIIATMCQSYADIGGNADEIGLRARIIDNTEHFVIMQMNSTDSVQLIADTIGTCAAAEKTYQVEEGLATGTGTIKRVEEYILHPNDIRHLSKNQGYLYSASNYKTKHFTTRFVDLNSHS